MGGQTNSEEAAPSSRTRSFLDDVVLTFSSPMAWLLVVALVITWSGVAIVLFDLLDYKTLTACPPHHREIQYSLPPPSAFAKRGSKVKGGFRPVKSSPAGVSAPESTDWLEMIWSFAASLVAPDEEEEGIHQLTDTLTSFHSEEL